MDVSQNVTKGPKAEGNARRAHATPSAPCQIVPKTAFSINEMEHAH